MRVGGKGEWGWGVRWVVRERERVGVRWVVGGRGNWVVTKGE